MESCQAVASSKSFYVFPIWCASRNETSCSPSPCALNLEWKEQTSIWACFQVSWCCFPKVSSSAWFFISMRIVYLLLRECMAVSWPCKFCMRAIYFCSHRFGLGGLSLSGFSLSKACIFYVFSNGFFSCIYLVRLGNPPRIGFLP